MHNCRIGRRTENTIRLVSVYQ